MIEFSYPTALLRLLDCPFDFLCPSCIELLFIWSQLVEGVEDGVPRDRVLPGRCPKTPRGSLVVVDSASCTYQLICFVRSGHRGGSA